jgi:6-phosphofructokinase 1
MRIGILTGGGDVPGLNACIRAVVLASEDAGHEVVGFRRGWRGVVDAADAADPFAGGHMVRLSAALVRGIERTGGTMLRTARFNPTVDAGDRTADMLALLERQGIGALIVVGGDGTLKSAAHLSALGVPVVAVPKTMDNDVPGTDYAIGFSTAVSRSVEAIDRLRTTVASHERVGIVELFGRRSGESALIAGFLAGADRTVIAEVPAYPGRLFPLLAADRDGSGDGCAVLVVSEGAVIAGEAGDDMDLSGSARGGDGVGRRLARAFEAATGVSTIVQELAYLMRSGAPDALDRMVGFAFGALAVKLLAEGRHGRMTAILDGNYATSDLKFVLEGARSVDVERLYDRHAFRAKLSGVEGLPMFLY